MNLLFYMDPDAFPWPDPETDEEELLHSKFLIEYNSPAIRDVRLRESVWIFTRWPGTAAYVLASRTVVDTRKPSRDRASQQPAVEGLTKWFDVESQPGSPEALIRSLDIATRHKRLYEDFRGEDAIRRISPQDHRQLLAWSMQLRNRDPEARDVVETVEVNMGEEVGGGGVEGETKAVVSRRYERKKSNRDACVALQGHACSVCGINFRDKYGEIGSEFIVVHHLTPLSSAGRGYKPDPLKDLIPVCPNCHSMLHRKNPPYTPEQLRKKLRV